MIAPKLLFPLNRGPRIGRFGLQLSFTNLSTLLSISILSTLISSSMYGKNYFKSAKSYAFWLKIDKDMIGCFKEMFLFSLNFLAVSIMLIVVAISSLIRSSLRFSIAFGMSRWWIESWYSFPSCLTHFLRFWYMFSVRKGTWGDIKMFVFKSTSKRTFMLTSMFYSSTSPFILGRLSLTYPLVRLSRNFTRGGTTL